MYKKYKGKQPVKQLIVEPSSDSKVIGRKEPRKNINIIEKNVRK